MDAGTARIPFINSAEFMREFTTKASELRVPLSGALELTHRCNLKCVHCYVSDRPPVEGRKLKELDTERFLSIIDEITNAGCLELLITGGEPLLRQDFSEIYRYAKLRGLIITVFTNGTLITDATSALFDDYPPYLVEVSLYGATAETYEDITGIPGSFAQCIRGIERLLSQGTRVKLKSMLMTLNSRELTAMEQMARDYGVSFRLDAALFPRLNGDRAPLELRLPPDEAVDAELADRERLKGWTDFCGRLKETPVSDNLPDDLYVCGAGTTGFHIDPFGMLRPCLMVRGISYDLQTGNFITGWNGTIGEISRRKPGPAYACSSCNLYALCGACPAFFELENGAEDVRSEYLCALGRERGKKLGLQIHGKCPKGEYKENISEKK